ncbi:hypothetical protein Tco_1340670 [Tanacetum coccineum]
MAVRILPGPADTVQAMKLRKRADIRKSGKKGVMPTQEYIKKLIEDVSEDANFTRGLWVSRVEYLNAEGGFASGNFGDIKTFCQNGKLEKVVAVFHEDVVLGDGTCVGGSEMLDEEELIQMLEEEARAKLDWQDSKLPCTQTYLRLTISPNVWSLNSLGLVPSCFAIFDLELLSLSLVLRSLNLFLVCLYRLFHLAILYLNQHAHTMHHLESLLTISLDNLCLDNLDIFKDDLEYKSLQKSLSWTNFRFLDS